MIISLLRSGEKRGQARVESWWLNVAGHYMTFLWLMSKILLASYCLPTPYVQVLRFHVDVTRALKVRKGKDSFVYRCEKSSDKRSLLSAYKTTSEELAARRRKEREGEQERRRSLWTAGEVRFAPRSTHIRPYCSHLLAGLHVQYTRV